MNHKEKHILIVEDESIVFLELEDLLSVQNFSIDDYTPSFKAAIERIENKKPDLVIIDIQLQGDLDGFDLGALLAKQYGIPFLYLTDYDHDANYERGLQTGHEFFFSKKKLSDEKLFIQTIRSILNRFENFNGVLGLVEYREKVREMELEW